MLIRDKLFIDGAWVAPLEPDWIEICSPFDGSTVGRVQAGGVTDVDRAVQAAAVAFQSWQRTPVQERANYLVRLSEYLASRADELCQLIVDEVGMPVRFARRLQTAYPIDNLRIHAEQALAFPFSQKIGHSHVHALPVGVVAAIAPWNYPFHQIVLKVAAALAAGCTLVLKPSEVTPLNAYLLADAAEAVGLPHGVLNIVTGTGAEVGQALVDHPLVDKISFTGSTATGAAIAAAAAKHLKRVTLELGGKSPSIVLDGANFEQAVRHTVAMCMLNSGQTCTALTRLLVPASRHDEIAELAATVARAMKVGDPHDPDTRIGPLVTPAQKARVLRMIEVGEQEAKQEGACRVMPHDALPPGLPERGNFVMPTIFAGVTSRMTLAREEIFGPVLCVMPYESEDQALEIAQDSDYGLAAAVWADSDARASALAAHLRAGQIDLNGGAFNPLAPFGGFKKSGYGREAGAFGIHDYLEYQSMQFPNSKV